MARVAAGGGIDTKDCDLAVVCSPTNCTTWRYLLQTLYNNESYADLVYTQNGKKVVFLPFAGVNCYSETERVLMKERPSP